jgi:hypothetical protein
MCMRIRIVTILALIPVVITASQVKPLEVRRGLSSPACGVDGIAIVAFITFIFIIPTAPRHPEMKFVICAIVVYLDVWVSASDLRLHKRHIGGQIVMKNSIVNPRCFQADHHGRCWVLRLLDLTHDCIKSVVFPPLDSSPVVCSRYSSCMYMCLQPQARLTTGDPLQCSRMRCYHHHFCG